MASTVAAASPSTGKGATSEVSLVRLYVIRASSLARCHRDRDRTSCPALIWPDPMGRGMIIAILGGLWVMALLGIRYPLQDGADPPVRIRLEDDLAAPLRAAAMAGRDGIAAD